MAFTRFHDDPCRQTKQLQQMTDVGRWILDVPGNGDKPMFMMDPQIIAQKWGGNLWTNSIDVQSNLLGIDKQLGRDCVDQSAYKRGIVYSAPIMYPTQDSFLTTEQSRAIMPAWTARDLTQNHGYILLDNPQNHTNMPFHNNTSTRIKEKQNFVRSFDCLIPENQTYTVPSITMTNSVKNGGSCNDKNSCSKL
jgi:hypothetical protein